MTKSRSSLLPLSMIVSMGFFCATAPAFAQRGGGSHSGGGFHGGGGGSHISGGSFRGGSSPAPSMAGSFSRGMSGSVARPSGGSYANGGSSANSGSYQRPGDYSPAVNSGYGNSRGEATSTAAGGYVRPDGQWHSFSVNRSADTPTGTRSFSGQGNEIWENVPAEKNGETANSAVASVRNSFTGSSSNTVSRSASIQTPSSAAALSARSSVGSGVGSGIVSSVPRNYNGFGGFRTNGGFGNYPYRGYRGGCWNCGFGFGFGWPLFGFGFYPYSYWPYSYWDDPWLTGGPGYGYYSDPSAYSVYNDGYNSSNDGGSYNPPQGYSSGPADNNPGPDQNVSGEQVTEQAPPYTNNGPVVQLYLKDGTVYSVQDYWLADGKLHFIVDAGVEFSFDLNQLDMQRTVDENARRGVQLVLKPAPNSQSNP
jgi:hypothetical protein